MPLGPGEDVVRDNIRNAPDTVVNTTTVPAAGGKTRVISVDYSSPTVEVGKTYCVKPLYINSDPMSANFGAARGVDETIE